MDLLTYNEGEDVDLPGLRIVRTPNTFLTRKVRPGFSVKKLICDVFLYLQGMVAD